MTNGEKYATATERETAFDQFCCKHRNEVDGSCDINTWCRKCLLNWLDLEAEDERQLPCPFCGSTDVVVQDVGGFELACQGCGFHTPAYMEKEKLISEYQRVARAVLAAKEDGNGNGQ